MTENQLNGPSNATIAAAIFASLAFDAIKGEAMRLAEIKPTRMATRSEANEMTDVLNNCAALSIKSAEIFIANLEACEKVNLAQTFLAKTQSDFLT